MRLTIIIFLCVTTRALPADIKARIVGGENAEIFELPWQVAMLHRSQTEFALKCGGAILSPAVVISSAHCAESTFADDWRARAGSTVYQIGGFLADIDHYLIHPSWGSEGGTFGDYDLVLFYTKQNIPLDGVTMALIGLPPANEIPTGVGMISGWGAPQINEPPVLTVRKAEIPILDSSACLTYYSASYFNSRMICGGETETGNLGPCTGDAGGPLVQDGILYGVSHHLYRAMPCSPKDYPPIYTLVSSFVDWINANIPDDNRNSY